MSIKEQLQFFSDHGVSVTYIAKRMGVSAPTLTKWLNGQKGITHKNENLLYSTLKLMTNELSSILE
jgi:DNA transposition AAA+ family ATPase